MWLLTVVCVRTHALMLSHLKYDIIIMYCDIGKHSMVIVDIELLPHGDIGER